MIKIKKALIALFIISTLPLVTEGYCASLRVPMTFSVSSEETDRMLGLEVMAKIRQFQTRGLKPNTINVYIKQAFEESRYHLQDRIRMTNDGFYVKAGAEYFEVTNGKSKNIDRVTFEQGRRILVKVMSGSYTKEKLVAEVRKVTAKLERKLGRPPNIRETAEAMPSLQTSRNPAALLYKHFQVNKLSPYDYGISRFSGKANLVIKKSAATQGMSFAFAGTRIFLPAQLSGKIEISAAKTPISKETKIDLVDRKDPKNRLTVEHIPEQDILRLTYTRPSGEEVISDIKGVKGKTSITITLNPVFSDFYDTIFSIPLYQGRERLEAVASHLRSKRIGTYFEQQERYVNFHGHLYLTSFYATHPGRIRVYRDRESWARFVVFEDMANPNNIAGYEWRDGKIIPLEKGTALEIDSTVLAEDKGIPLYYLNRSDVFKNFDEQLDKTVETIIATPDDMRLSEISIGTGRFTFRVKRNVSVFSFEGQRSKENITRDDRSMYPIKIVRLDDKSEIKIGYRNPDMQGEFVVAGLNWEDGSPVVLKGPSGYEGKRGYFNLSTIIEMLRQDLLPGIEASNWIMETFGFSEGANNLNLRNPIRSYKIERSASGEKFLVEDVLVDPTTFLPWEGGEATPMASNAMLALQKEGLRLFDIGTHTGSFLDNVAQLNPRAEKLVGIDSSAQPTRYKVGNIEIEKRQVNTQAGNWATSVEMNFYDIATIVYPNIPYRPDFNSLLGVARYSLNKQNGVLFVVADSEAYAEELKGWIETSTLFINVRVLPLPEAWPLSGYVGTISSREGHRLIIANPRQPGQNAGIAGNLNSLRETSSGL